MNVWISNSLSTLIKALDLALMECEVNPLQKKWVIIPHEALKNDLYLRWLCSKDVITGITFITYSQLIAKLFPAIPSFSELKLRIALALNHITLPSEIKSYLSTGDVKKEGFIQQMCHLFLNALHQDQHAIKTWLNEQGWQQELWKALFSDQFPLEKTAFLPGSFFFYNISSVKAHEWQLFSQMQTNWFLLSPSQMFLGDLKTGQEQRKLLNKASPCLQEEMVFYFAQDPPLLANWKEVCHKQLHLFEDALTTDLFTFPSSSSMLHQLQREWLTLDRQQTKRDHSLQLHSAPSKLREVEVVWELLHQLGRQGRDALILAPDMDEYAPLIQWVFSERQGSFDYRICGIKASRIDPILEGISLLLTLPKYRFSKEIMEKLWVNAPFLKRKNMTPQEGMMMIKWMETFELHIDLETGPQSWKSALQRAVHTLILSETTASTSLEWSDACLLNTWITLTDQITQLLKPLLTPFNQSAADWGIWLKELIETFFEKEEALPQFQTLLHLLNTFEDSHPLPYCVIEPLILSIGQARSGKTVSTSFEAIQFAPLSPGMLIPAKTIILMGMDESAFPRYSVTPSLSPFPFPSSVKEDQDLFLKVLTAAQENVIITYTRCHSKDGKELKVSSLVTELQKDREEILTVHHPLFAHDALYFQEEGLQSVSTSHYELSVAPSPLPREVTSLLSPIKSVIQVRALKKLARHPVQFFLEEGLGLKFPRQAPMTEFILPPYLISSLRAQSHLCLEELSDQLEQQGILPTGVFKEAALLAIKQDLCDYHETLAAFDLSPSSLSTVIMTPHCTSSYPLDHATTIIPAVKIPLASGEIISLEGSLEGVCEQGFFFQGDFSLEDLLKVWPLYCLTAVILDQQNLPLFSSKKREKKPFFLPNPLEALTRYIHYFQEALIFPSPLLPSLGKSFLKEQAPLKLEDDLYLNWALKQQIIPPLDQWEQRWRSSLQGVFHELL
ncbi:MAG: exodeoxyribonuclease V subunit gamma [Candidatus Rhabdochlamydia sp.]